MNTVDSTEPPSGAVVALANRILSAIRPNAVRDDGGLLWVREQCSFLFDAVTIRDLLGGRPAGSGDHLTVDEVQAALTAIYQDAAAKTSQRAIVLSAVPAEDVQAAERAGGAA